MTSRSCFNRFIVYRPVYAPVNSFIADKRVSACYNVVQLLAVLLGILYTSYRSRQAAPFDFGSNMWMDPLDEKTISTATDGKIPPYCSNPRYNFTYDPGWQYNNITCRVLPSSQTFIKSLTEGTYFVSTMIQQHQFGRCPSNHAAASLKNLQDVCIPKIKSSKTSFVLGIDNAMLHSMVFVAVPAVGYPAAAGNIPSPLPLTIETVNGTIIHLPASSPSNMVRSFPMRRWFEFFGLPEEGLDAPNPMGSVPDVSDGVSRHRHVGMSVEIRVLLSNTKRFYDFPSSDIDRLKVKWIISMKPIWTRIILQDTPNPYMMSETESIDLYGIRIKWISMTSEIFIFSWFNFFMGLIDCVVIFNVAKLVAVQAALTCCGSKSNEWEKALKSPIDILMVSQHEARKEHKRRSTVVISAKNGVKTNNNNMTTARGTTIVPETLVIS